MQVLHVEQEVLGDGTTALESLLSCDTERSALLKVPLWASFSQVPSQSHVSSIVLDVCARHWACLLRIWVQSWPACLPISPKTGLCRWREPLLTA